MADPIAFLEEYVQHHGGMAERRDDHLLLLAPESLPGLPEMAEFWVRPEPPPEGAEPLHLGHPYLSRALELARTGGNVAFRYYPEARTHRPGLEHEIRQAFGFRNARLELGPDVRACVPWALFHYRATAVWDEKREELATVGIDLQTGLPVDVSVLDRSWLERGRPPGMELSGLKEAYEASLSVLERQLEPRVESFCRQSQRHLELELKKQEAYYDGVAADLRRRLESASAERQDALHSKLEQARRDREARGADLREKFRVKLTARLSCLEVVGVPRLLVPARLQGKKVAASLRLSYNFLTHGLDPVACTSCGQGGYVFYLCGESHRVCPGCHQECPGCRRVACPRCPRKRCSDCGAALCAHCLHDEERCPACAAPPALAPRPPEAARAPQPATAPEPATARAPGRPEPAAPRAARSQPMGAGREGLILRIFPPSLGTYLWEVDRLVGTGRTREAGEALEAVARRLHPEVGEMKERLHQVSRILLRDRPRLAIEKLEALARSPGPAPREDQAAGPVELVRRLVRNKQLVPELGEATIRLLQTCSTGIDPRKRSEGWAAAALYAVARANRWPIDQAQVADLFGISPSTVSNRFHELLGVLESARSA